MKRSLFPHFALLAMLVVPISGWALSDEGKAFADEQISELSKTPRIGSAFVQRIASKSDECLLYALPKLVAANSVANEAGSESYTLILLTRVAQIKEPAISQEMITALEKIADPKNADHNACLTRIRLLIKPK